jgi:hypothetical protein
MYPREVDPSVWPVCFRILLSEPIKLRTAESIANLDMLNCKSRALTARFFYAHFKIKYRSNGYTIKSGGICHE